MKLNTTQKTILGGAAMNIKNIMKQSGGGKSLTGGGGASTKTMIQMYVVAVTACCFAKKFGAVPNIEVLVKYFFSELLDQGDLYKPEWFHIVLESIYLTYAHLGQDQSRPLACNDERDVGYITSYESRAGEDCEANIDNFGELVTAICVTLLLTTLLAGGITMRALHLEGQRAITNNPTTSSSNEMVQFVVMDKQTQMVKDGQMTQILNSLGEKDKQISLLLKSIGEKDKQIANMVAMAYAQGAFQEIVNDITQRLERLSGGTNDLTQRLDQLTGEVYSNPNEEGLTVETLRTLLEMMRGARFGCKPPLNALAGSYPTNTNGGYKKRNVSLKSRLKLKRNSTRHRRKKR